MKYLFLTSSLLLLMVSCRPEKQQETGLDYRIDREEIVIPQHSNLRSKLKLDTVKNKSWQMQFSSAGMVREIPNFFAEISSPFSGRVTKIFLHLGMKVKPGTPLFELASAEFTEAQKNYFSAQSALRKDELNLSRQRDLLRNGVAAHKDLEEAQSAWEVSSKEYQNSRAALKIYHADPDKLVFGQPLLISSPIKGEVIQNELVNGQYLKTEDAPKVKVAELNKVWVAAQVKEKDIRFIHPGDEVAIEVAAYPGRKISGRVYHLEDLIDEETRSLKVLVECDNRDYSLKPGMYVSAQFSGKPENVLVIPGTALLQMNDQSFVFVQTAAGRFIRRKVQTSATANEQVVISSGLKAGESILTEGGFYLLQAK